MKSDGFFDEEKVRNNLNRLIHSIPSKDSDGPNEKKMNVFLERVFRSMLSRAPEWNQAADFLHEETLNEFTEFLGFDPKRFDKEKYDELFIACHQLVTIMYFIFHDTLDRQINEIRFFVQNNRDRFSDHLQTRIDFIENGLSNIFFARLVRKGNISKLIEFENNVENLKLQIDEFDENISEKESRVTALANKLDEQQTEYNFVLLNKGFANLQKSKTDKLNNLKNLAVGLAIGMVILLVSEIAVVIFMLVNSVNITANLLYLVLPSISLLVLLIYFFRIVVVNHKHLGNQILQLELRQSLCQFIQSYSEYAEEINKKTPDTLSRFENLIFSEIVSDEKNLVSPYDGIEQITNLLKAGRQK